MSAKRLAELRAGLLYCSPAHQPVIQAMIDKLLAEQSGIPARDVAPGECWAFREHRSQAEIPPPGGAGVEGWRLARKALRQAGHLVEQQGGIVYVDGKRCDDPALQAV